MSRPLDRIQALLGESLYAQFLDSNPDDVQFLLQKKLRQLAIEHLRTANTPLACAFRAEYGIAAAQILEPNWQAFLDKQSRNAAWGTYIELAALGELFDMDVTVSCINGKHESKPFCVHRASDDAHHKPSVHLYNQSNCHWFVPGGTRGDGNCLYNAFAQLLRTFVKPKPVPISVPDKKDEPVLQTKASFFGSNCVEQKSIQLQYGIEQAIAKQRTPKQVEQDFEVEKARLAKLSSEEQQQIAEDYKLALALARDELKAVGSADVMRCFVPETKTTHLPPTIRAR